MVLTSPKVINSICSNTMNRWTYRDQLWLNNSKLAYVWGSPPCYITYSIITGSITTESIHSTLYHTITSVKTPSLLSTIGNVICYMLYYKVVVVCQIKEDLNQCQYMITFYYQCNMFIILSFTGLQSLTPLSTIIQ